MTYKPGYSEQHSPFYDRGYQDGSRDAARMRADPPKEPRGMDPERSWSAMYQRGYDAGMLGS